MVDAKVQPRKKQTIYQMIIIKYDLDVVCVQTKGNLTKTGMI